MSDALNDTQKPHDPAVILCKNCSTPVAGFTYCPVCAQKTDTHVLTFRELLEELADGLFNMDSRLWNSLIPLIAHPGRLTKEYLAGRRMLYLPPFRLYLILSVLFFLIPDPVLDADNTGPETATMASNNQPAILRNVDDDSTVASADLGRQIREEVTRELETARSESGEVETIGDNEDCSMQLLPQDALTTVLLHQTCLKFIEDPDALFRQLADNVPLMMIIGMPLVALFMQLMYVFSGRYYVEHIIFLFHTHAFFFLISIITTFSSYIGERYPALFGLMDWIRIIGGFYIPVYIFLAMLKVYGDSKTRTFFKALFLMVGYGTSVMVVAFFGLMFTALTS